MSCFRVFLTPEVISEHFGPENLILPPKAHPGTRSEVCTCEIYVKEKRGKKTAQEKRGLKKPTAQEKRV